MPYTPEPVFGRSPAPLPGGVSKMPGRGEPGVFVGFHLGWCRGLGWSFWGQVCRSAAGVVSTQPFASAHELAQPALRNLHHRVDRPASGEMVSTRAAPSSQPGSTNFKKLHRDPAQPALRNLHHRVDRPASERVVSTRAAPSSQPGSTNFKEFLRSPVQPTSKSFVAARLNRLQKSFVAARFNRV